MAHATEPKRLRQKKTIHGKPEYLAPSEFTRENLRINITDLHGEEIYQLFRTFEKLRVKRSRLLCTLTFLQRCRDQNITPKCVTLSHHKKTKSTKTILHRASMALLRDEIHSTRRQLGLISKELLCTHLQLCHILHPLLWQRVDNLTEFRCETEAALTSTKQKTKFEKLQQQQKTAPRKEYPNAAVTVYNISDKTLSKEAKQVLSKGFNYAIAPSRIPTEEIISNVESSILKLDHNNAEIVRQEVCKILRTSKPPKRNISREEREALALLRKDDSIIVLPADKGNATVVMNMEEYKFKMAALLADPIYQPTNTDPTTYLEKTTRTKILETPLDAETKKSLIPREKSSRCPKLYGLPKIHKADVPLRPIVSSFGSPLHSLARFLAKYLQPHAEQATSYVKNSIHLIEILKEQRINPGDLLVSFDVVSLFTKVPIQEATSIIEEKCSPPRHMMELIRHCLKNTYFLYGDQRYKQTEGAPMGSPLSPVTANLFMESLETKALDRARKKPSLWLRYVDDTFVIWPHGLEELHHFLDHLNQQHSTIKFTMEVEEKNALPFLDVLITKKLDGTLGHTVYRKSTHTNRYLNAQSHHHPAQLHSVAKTLITRSQRLADDANRDAEMGKIHRALLSNGYTKRQIRNAERPKAPKSEEKDIQAKAFLPYVQGTTDKISRVLKKHKIDTIFKPYQKISSSLRNPKTIIPLESHGVYSIPCVDCGGEYVGQTNRRMHVRREEHKKAVENNDQKSSLVQHMKKTGHQIDFDNMKTIATIEHFTTRTTREAIEIEKRKDNLNSRDDGQRLPTAWAPAIKAVTNIRGRQLTRESESNENDSHSTSSTNETTRQAPPVTRSQTKKDPLPKTTAYKKRPPEKDISSTRVLRPRRKH